VAGLLLTRPMGDGRACRGGLAYRAACVSWHRETKLVQGWAPYQIQHKATQQHAVHIISRTQRHLRAAQWAHSMASALWLTQTSSGKAGKSGVLEHKSGNISKTR